MVSVPRTMDETASALKMTLDIEVPRLTELEPASPRPRPRPRR